MNKLIKKNTIEQKASKKSQPCSKELDVRPGELSVGSKSHKVSEGRSLLSYAAHRKLGLSAAEISRAMNVSIQAILQGAVKTEESWESLDWIIEGLEM